MDPEIRSLIEVWLAIITSLSYCYYIATKIPKGKLRLFSLLPIFSLFTLLPRHFTYAFPTAVAAFFITWLSNFKILLFAFDLGPLSTAKPFSLFVTLACLPLQQKSSKPRNRKKLPLNLGLETAILSLLMGISHSYRERMHPKFLLAVYCFMVFLMVEVLISLSNKAARALIGLELEPPSDEPYLSTSLQDFWGRRWNLMVTSTLRSTIYKPIVSASVPVLGRHLAPLPGVLAGFVVSGLMHELLFYYVTRVDPTWEMTAFFVLQGVCVVAELILKRAVSGKLRLPGVVSGLLTVGFVVATSFWLFFPPLLKSGADVKVLEEFQLFVDFIKRNVVLIWEKIM